MSDVSVLQPGASSLGQTSATTGTNPRIALAGHPNCGKTALFNAITGGRQKVGNYAGVTVERKEGSATSPSGKVISVLDLPGTYSLDARTPDEEVTRDVILGRLSDESAPEALIAVADATNLERSLGLVLEVKELGVPVVLALNMMDLAAQRGLELDLEVLQRELEVPIVPTVAVKRLGVAELLREVESLLGRNRSPQRKNFEADAQAIRARFARVDQILERAIRRKASPAEWTKKIDQVVLHPLWGTLLLASVLLVMFQAIFNWASIPADFLEVSVGSLGEWISARMADGPLKSLLVEGVIAGVGSVIVFLPQILLLFAFILALEDSGYMARAAFLMDRWMGKVGLHGRAFIPLLSSYACAIPGIMATRTIENRRDRLSTILIAPLTTCSARLPVYTLVIAAFIPNLAVGGVFGLQGLVMFALYLAGIVIALIMALIFRRTLLKGPKPPLLLELPTYKWPDPRNVLVGLWERSRLFLRRAGTVILTLSIVLWFLASYPKAPQAIGEGAAAGADAQPAISYSYAGQIGRAIEPALRPLGFDWRISVALIPGFAAREVMVSALATVYAIEGDSEEKVAESLGSRLRADWTLATALSLLMWYVLAPQCLSTLAVVRRETNSWRWTFFLLTYLTVLAYVGSFVTYQLASRIWPGV
jgi:ferrous iron transport protein B